MTGEVDLWTTSHRRQASESSALQAVIVSFPLGLWAVMRYFVWTEQLQTKTDKSLKNCWLKVFKFLQVFENPLMDHRHHSPPGYSVKNEKYFEFQDSLYQILFLLFDVSLPSHQPTRDDRGWLINPVGPNPWWTTIITFIPALLCTILIFMDQQITAVIINRKEHKLKVSFQTLNPKISKYL